MKPEIRRPVEYTRLYNQLEPGNFNPHNPRVGYYEIIRRADVCPEDGPAGAIYAYWRPEHLADYDRNFIVRVQLQSLARNPFPGSNKFLEGQLQGRTIHVRKSEFLTNRPRLYVDWQILDGINQSLILEKANKDSKNIFILNR